MLTSDTTLLPGVAPASAALSGTGILPYQAIREMLRANEILAPHTPIELSQVQPASLDLRLGAVAYRVRASFLPGPAARVEEKLQDLGMHQVDLRPGAVLEKGCVYMVPLQEQLQLPSRISAFANPKSSTGRLDVFTRLIADRTTAFDRIEAGYVGPLYLEVAPRTFSIKVRAGDRLNQIRFRRGQPATSAAALKRLHEQFRLTDAPPGRENIRDDSISVSLDLSGDETNGLIGFRAKPHADVIDVSRHAFYDPLDFWEPIYRRDGRGIVLSPSEFYILATKEAVTVPPDHAAEMMAYDALVGEFRVHYAGFFDPGFGYAPEAGGARRASGAKAVLEVRSHDVPFMLEHEQTVGWLRYEKLAATPDRLYGQGVGSSYQGQGLMLAKQFKPLI